MIHPPDYSKDFLLYIAASATTIAMVLVQDNLHGQEHVIYYDSKNLIDSKTRYSHVEKLSLATVIAVQKFHHYILLRTTTTCHPWSIGGYYQNRFVKEGEARYPG